MTDDQKPRKRPSNPAALRDEMRREQLAASKARRAARPTATASTIGKGRRYAKPKGRRA